MPERLRFGLAWSATVIAAFLARAAALADVEAEAIAGRPFGVCRISVWLPPGEGGVNADAAGLVERDGRALYPAVASGRLRNLLGQLLGERFDQTRSVMTVLFLFTGDQPLQLALYAPTANAVTVVPGVGQPRQHARLLARWWREYNACARRRGREPDYPPLVETYLTSTLSRRLGLPTPLLSRWQEAKEEPVGGTFQLLLGGESLRDVAMRETALGRTQLGEAADQPLPAEIRWTPYAAPAADADILVEPIAMQVPEECFYMRFGTFSNYLWLQHLLEDYGGDVRGMISAPGRQRAGSQRVERQIALQRTVLVELMGDQVVADAAIIGRDLYLQDGPAIGILFQARNELLGPSIQQQRGAAMAQEREHGAAIETVKISGRDVSLLSTPDNRLRSFYAVNNAYHLVTTCRAMVERFFAAGEGRGALGRTPEFRHARTIVPVGREDTVFLYLSSAFFRGLLSPQYQIELARRVQSAADLELVRLARLAARAEKKQGGTIDELIAGGLLPQRFGRRPDGSGPVFQKDSLADSLRGARGSFTPVPDVPLQGVTRSEAARAAVRAAYYEENWRSLDPLMAAVNRLALDRKGRERIVADAYLSLGDEKKYGWIARLLGSASTERISTAPEDLITAQAALSGGRLERAVRPHQLFLGVQDDPALGDLRPAGLPDVMQLLRTAPWYLGAWPQPGFLAPFAAEAPGQPQEGAATRLPLGFWRRQADDFFLLSSDGPLLDRVAPQLRVVQDDNAAHVRVRVSDLSQTKLARLISAVAYGRALRASQGNARLLQSLSQQLHVPPEESLATAEELLDAKLVCPLGGQYQLAKPPGALACWQSDQWPAADEDRLPDSYDAPLMQWFRGLQLQLTKQRDQVVAHAELEMQRKPGGPVSPLPLLDFDFFGKPKTKEPAPKRGDARAKRADECLNNWVFSVQGFEVQ